MKTEQQILITSIVAGSDLSAKQNLYVSFNGTVCAVGVKPLGVLNANANLGEMAPVVCAGIALVYSGAAITVGSKLQSDAAGKAIIQSFGELAGYALDAATGTDELIRVLLCS
jgi:hypothetical protein